MVGIVCILKIKETQHSEQDAGLQAKLPANTHMHTG